MANKLKIGILLGSTRDGRLCDRVAEFVRRAVAKDHEAIKIDPKDLDLPQTQQSMNWMMNPSAVPDNIRALNEIVTSCDALIAVTPEYNWSIPPALANVVDNIPPTTFTFKPCSIVNYSVSPVSGWRGGMQVRQLFGALGCTITQKQLGVGVAQESLTPEGEPKSESLAGDLQNMLGQLYWLTKAMNAYSKVEPRPTFAM